MEKDRANGPTARGLSPCTLYCDCRSGSGSGVAGGVAVIVKITVLVAAPECVA